MLGCRGRSGPGTPTTPWASQDESCSCRMPPSQELALGGGSHGWLSVPARHPTRLTLTTSERSSGQGCSNPTSAAAQAPPRQVRGARDTSAWGGCAPLPPPQDLPNLFTCSLDVLMYRDRCGCHLRRGVQTALGPHGAEDITGGKGPASRHPGQSCTPRTEGRAGRWRALPPGEGSSNVWPQPFCRLKCQPEVTDLDPAKSTDTQTSSWEAPPARPPRTQGSQQPPTQEGSFPDPGPQTLGRWLDGRRGRRGVSSPLLPSTGGQELHHHPEPKRGARGLSLPSGRREPGAWASPRRTREGTHSHTRPHVLTQVHSYVYTWAHPLPHTHSHILTPTQTPAHMLTLTHSQHTHRTHSLTPGDMLAVWVWTPSLVPFRPGPALDINTVAV